MSVDRDVFPVLCDFEKSGAKPLARTGRLEVVAFAGFGIYRRFYGLYNAAAVIFAHNHPSGVAEPSHADELLTRTLKEALALVDVKVLDHFIVAGASILSFAERGLGYAPENGVARA